MSYKTYQEVSHLKPDTLRLLLINGDATERLWAVWSLGLALGTDSFPGLKIHLHEEPEPGIRRHLLVMFAGEGNQEILRVFAQDDPDAFVRARACQYLIRINLKADKAIYHFIKTRLHSDTSSIVKRIILTEMANNSHVLQLEDLANLVNDEDFQVRKLTVNYLLERYSPDQLFPGILENHAQKEPDDDLRNELLSLSLKSGGALRLLELSKLLDSQRKLEILTHLVDLNMSFSWNLLEHLSKTEDPFTDVLLVQLIRPSDILDSLQWLLERMAQAYHLARPRNREESKRFTAARTTEWKATNILISSLPQIKIDEIREIKPDPRLVQNSIAYLQERIQQLHLDREDEWNTDDENYEQVIQEYQNLLQVLEQIYTTE